MRYTRAMAPELQGPRAVQFRCTQCGECCRKPGVVEMTHEDIQAIARHLELTASEFLTQYDLQWQPQYERFELPGPTGCPLHGVDGRCTVDSVKPMQCRTYPFWPENLASQRSWQEAARDCEGIDAEGSVTYDADTIRAIARARRGT